MFDALEPGFLDYFQLPFFRDSFHGAETWETQEWLETWTLAASSALAPPRLSTPNSAAQNLLPLLEALDPMFLLLTPKMKELSIKLNVLSIKDLAH